MRQVGGGQPDVGFRFYQADSTPEEQLGQFLRRKHMLLVLDNFEHLIGEATLHFVTDLLATAPDVTVLVTSRVRLNIQGEQLFPLHVLDVPQSVTQGETKVIATDITTAAEALSAQQRAEAEERGRVRDLWEVAAKLAGDLAEQG
ncbi:MAG: hypothetical protein U9R25_08360 [Chloroflexota bacterium]|nr:hypothetical protein [Chloroflexota bacterium]